MSHVADFFDFPLILRDEDVDGGVTNEAGDSNFRFLLSESNLKRLFKSGSIFTWQLTLQWSTVSALPTHSHWSANSIPRLIRHYACTVPVSARLSFAVRLSGSAWNWSYCSSTILQWIYHCPCRSYPAIRNFPSRFLTLSRPVSIPPPYWLVNRLLLRGWIIVQY